MRLNEYLACVLLSVVVGFSVATPDEHPAWVDWYALSQWVEGVIFGAATAAWAFKPLRSPVSKETDPGTDERWS